MTAKFKFLTVLCFLFACNQEHQETSTPPALFKAPQLVKLDTNQGYSVNQLKGDSLFAHVNESGDTIPTGKLIKLMTKQLNSDSLLPPEVKSANSFSTRPNPFEEKGQRPKNLIGKRLDTSLLIRSRIDKINEKDRDYLVNGIGDTIYTGEPLAVSPKIISFKMKRSIPALPPQFKDAAQRDIQYMDVDQGLQSSYVWSALEDSRGNIWLGYDANGVSKYDGNSLIHFSEQEGLIGNLVNAIKEDHQGRIWFATDEGVSCLDGQHFLNFSQNEGLLSKYIQVIEEDRDGNFWIGSRLGVTKYDGEKFTHFTENEAPELFNVLSLEFDSDGHLWIGTGQGALFEFDGSQFINYTKALDLKEEPIRYIFEDSDRDLWLVTHGRGVVRFDGEFYSEFSKQDGLCYNYLYTVSEDSSGDLWFTSNGEGVSRFDGEYFYTLSTDDGLSSNYVRDVMQDRSGQLWMVTDGGGVNIYNPNSFKHYTKELGIEDPYITSIYKSADHDLYMGTYFEGVLKMNQDSISQYTLKDGFTSERIWSIEEAREDGMWFGTHGAGAIHFDGKQFEYYGMEQGLSDDFILSILEDSKQNLWFGTSRNGLTLYNGEAYTHFSGENGLIKKSVITILEDQDGNIWFSTYGGGISKYDGKYITHFTEKEGLSSNYVWCLLQDRYGKLWIGTKGGGVNIFDGSEFTYLTEKEGLSNNIVWSLVEDEEGSIWAGTEKGLNKISQHYHQGEGDQPIDYSVKSYYKNDGLLGLDFIGNSVFIDGNNKIWWGTGKSLTTLDLNRRTSDESVPRLSMESIELNGSYIDYRNLSDSLSSLISMDSVKRFSNYPLNLELPFSLNHLTFYFSATDWIAPHKIKYSYILQGVDEKWSSASTDNKVDYRNLPYGTHTLKVKAIGASQVWSETFAYTFTILPPWYHSWWARILYFIAGILLIWGYARWRTISLKKRQLQLEHEVLDATQEISAQKEEAEKQRDVIEEAHNEIKDSIQYAKRIQSAILPPSKLFNSYLPKNFVIYKPKDVVAGDFYWLEKKDGKVLFAAADCTGHGVPGAMVSVVCNNGLNRSVREYGITEPAKILDKTRDIVLEEFEKSDEDVKDGMDIALCALKGHELEYSGANNPLWIIRRGEIAESELGDLDKGKIQRFDDYFLAEIKADKQPIGKYDQAKPYVNHSISLKKGDRIYIFSDGLADQFGGELGKKLKTINVKRFLISIQNIDMEAQGKSLSLHFDEWKRELQQVDDVCFIGVEI